MLIDLLYHYNLYQVMSHIIQHYVMKYALIFQIKHTSMTVIKNTKHMVYINVGLWSACMYTSLYTHPYIHVSCIVHQQPVMSTWKFICWSTNVYIMMKIMKARMGRILQLNEIIDQMLFIIIRIINGGIKNIMLFLVVRMIYGQHIVLSEHHSVLIISNFKVCSSFCSN